MDSPSKKRDHSRRPDYSDLEHAEAYDAPQVVDDFHQRAHVRQNLSTDSPQVHKPQHYTPEYGYYAGQHDARPYYENEKPALDNREGERPAIKDSKRVKMCGMRPKVFFWVLGAVITILVLAAVLGGVLGTVLGKSDSNSQSGSSSNQTTESLQSIGASTGLAAIRPNGTSTLFQYYQDKQGRIIENQYNNGKWLIQGDSVPKSSIVGSDASGGSPIAATSYLLSGTLFRQVFYLNGNGQIMSSNTTGTNDWPTPYSILPEDAAISGTKALSVCADSNNDALSGLRVYYASSDLRIIREVGLDFDEGVWTLWQTFPGSDPYSGAATVLVVSINHLYLVNSSTGALQQWTWDYANHIDASWQSDVQGSSYIAGDSDIAATYDGIVTDYIFYEGSDKNLVRALYYGQSISDEQNIATLASGSKLSTTFDDSLASDAATVFFQAADNSSEIEYETIDRHGNILSTAVVS